VSLPEPSAEVVEAGARAAYESVSRATTGADGPEQQRLGRVTWEELAALPRIRSWWIDGARACLIAALARALELAPPPPEPPAKPEPIDLAKNLAKK
jgi:hypothetical protein